MRIGLVTMHWGRNYGALLQAYATSAYLQNNGHEVYVINYKPSQYDSRMMDFILHPRRLLGLKEALAKQAIDRKIGLFRNAYLNQTKRYYTEEELRQENFDYDMFISGSDQILNPGLTLNGEGHPSSVYFLGFTDKDKRRISYASSFGCVEYPANAEQYAKEWIQNFQEMGVREDTGLSILEDLGYKGNAIVVPDPTVLLGEKLFEKMNLEQTSKYNSYYYVHTLRFKRISIDSSSFEHKRIVFGDSVGALKLDEWLNVLYNSCGIITNSYHASIMAILMHKPFSVILEKGEASGMNDRFFTLFKRIGLLGRIVDNDNQKIKAIMKTPIDWNMVDERISEFRKIGVDYLVNCLSK